MHLLGRAPEAFLAVPRSARERGKAQGFEASRPLKSLEPAVTAYPNPGPGQLRENSDGTEPGDWLAAYLANDERDDPVIIIHLLGQAPEGWLDTPKPTRTRGRMPSLQ
jgi:hypothetical protein